VCRCDLGIDKTAIEELQVLSHILSRHEIRNNCFIYGENISNQKFRPGGVYYLSTSAKLYSEIGQNYCIICNFDRWGYGV
jgi:hypothetical protein